MYRVIARLLFYPTLAWNLLLNRILPHRTWYSRIDEHVWIGAFPFRRIVRELHAEGVRAVVNTCEEYEGPCATYEELGIQQLHIPTVDFTPPSVADVDVAVSFIEDHVARGESVYVHCKAGRGRSATIVLCWLMAAKGISAKDAQELLASKRAHVLNTVYRRQVVEEFAKQRGILNSTRGD